MICQALRVGLLARNVTRAHAYPTMASATARLSNKRLNLWFTRKDLLPLFFRKRSQQEPQDRKNLS